MNGLIVFNSANDVVFQQFNGALETKLREIAVSQGLLERNQNSALDGNVILQIFSPIINSQRIMHCQFDNTYASFQCDNDLNFTFQDLLGFTFLKIGERPVEQLKRQTGIAVALARRLFGPNLFATQANSVQEEILSSCLQCYEDKLCLEEQSMIMEALPRLLVNAELKRSVGSTLDAALDRLRELAYPKAHVLMFVSHQFVAGASSKPALALSAPDLLFIALLVRSLHRSEEEKTTTSRCFAVFLQGASHDPNSGCVPCIVNISKLEKAVVLVQIIEYANLQVASSMYDAFFILQKIASLQLQGDSDALRPAYDSLEVYIKQTLDALKRAKLRGDDLEASLKKLNIKWENLRKIYGEYFKTFDRDLLVRIESNIPAFAEELKQLFTITCCDSSSVLLDQLPEVSAVVESKLLEFVEFLAVKAERNISIEAYLEDFPGLVHFAYINRSSGLMIAPDLRTSEVIPKERLHAMVEFTRNYLKKGQCTMMWRDKTFHYSYFLWFEDAGNGALKSIDMQQYVVGSGPVCNAFKSQYEPGAIASDWYQELTETCFPKMSPGKVKCYELFCVHLGLVTAKCASEHARRLVATVADVAGEDHF